MFVEGGGIPFEREMSQRDKRIAVLQGGRPPLKDGISSCFLQSNLLKSCLCFAKIFGHR